MEKKQEKNFLNFFFDQSKENFFTKNLPLWLTLAGCMLFYFFYHDYAGGTLFVHNGWDSYTLQAQAWLKGQFALDHDYPYLELAIYNGKYYVSFPPLPALLYLPFVLIFGGNTPNNFLQAVFALLSLPPLYFAFSKSGYTRAKSAVLALVAFFGSNLLFMSTIGGVWFIAQVSQFLFLAWALYFFVENKRALCTFFIALAVGCRPLSALYLPCVFFLFLIKDKEKNRHASFGQLLRAYLPCIASALAVGLVYMLYNQLRFGHPLEFGHNYLPEFTREEHGQFSLVYLWPNLKKALFGKIALENGRLSFSYFGDMAFMLANPLFLGMGIELLADSGKKRFSPAQLLPLFFLCLHLVLLCCHRTLGGWQFGCRYTCDLIPYVLFIFLHKKKPSSLLPALCLGVFGIFFNLYGALCFLQNL